MSRPWMFVRSMCCLTLKSMDFAGRLLCTSDEAFLEKHKYSIIKKLGKGTYSTVKEAYSGKLKQNVALKIVNTKKAGPLVDTKFLPRELSILKHVNHPNIIKTFEILEYREKVYMAMEFAGHGDLLEYLLLKGALDEPSTRAMFSQICDGIQYLHSHHIAHRDLKCENILLNQENRVKLTDFGFARYFRDMSDMSQTFCGSLAYSSPEVLRGIPYFPPYHDIWALGVILYILLCGQMPYDDRHPHQMLLDQLNDRLKFICQPGRPQPTIAAKNLVRNILQSDLCYRYSLGQILQHPWMISPEPFLRMPQTLEIKSSGEELYFQPGERPVFTIPRPSPRSSESSFASSSRSIRACSSSTTWTDSTTTSNGSWSPGKSVEETLFLDTLSSSLKMPEVSRNFSCLPNEKGAPSADISTVSGTSCEASLEFAMSTNLEELVSEDQLGTNVSDQIKATKSKNRADEFPGSLTKIHATTTTSSTADDCGPGNLTKKSTTTTLGSLTKRETKRSHAPGKTGKYVISALQPVRNNEITPLKLPDQRENVPDYRQTCDTTPSKSASKSAKSVTTGVNSVKKSGKAITQFPEQFDGSLKTVPKSLKKSETSIHLPDNGAMTVPGSPRNVTCLPEDTNYCV